MGGDLTAVIRPQDLVDLLKSCFPHGEIPRTMYCLAAQLICMITLVRHTFSLHESCMVLLFVARTTRMKAKGYKGCVQEAECLAVREE